MGRIHRIQIEWPRPTPRGMCDCAFVRCVIDDVDIAMTEAAGSDCRHKPRVGVLVPLDVGVLALAPTVGECRKGTHM